MSYIPDTSFETKTVLSGSYSSEIVNISTADDYYTLMNSTDPTVLNKQYKLLQNIQISNVKSIGTLANPFTGGFDGNNKKITILSLDSTTNTLFRGIIGVIGGNTNYIKNINLVINDVTNMRITTPDSWIECGCIAGSSLSSNLIIDNCSVLLNNLYINPYSANFGTRAGIIIGYGLNTTISNCNVEWKLYGGFFANSMYNSLTTLSKYASTGIIMGEGINCTINNVNIIIPSFEVVGITFFGYICGRIKNSSISNCNIVANFGARYISYFGILGSLVGVLVSTNVSNFKLITSNLSMITSDGTGEISSYKLVAGGLIGYLAQNTGKTITNCFVVSRYDQGSTIRGYYSSQFITMSDENIGTIQNCFLYIPSITTVTVSGSQYNIYSLSAAIQAISGSSNSNNIRVFVTSEIDAVSTIIQGINTVINKTLDIYYYLKAFYYTGYAQIVNLLKQADGTSYSTFIINAANGIVQARGEAFITVPVTYADIKGLLSNNLAESEYKDSDTLPIHYSVINNSNRVYIQNGPTAETVMQNTILPYSSISKLYFPGDYEKAIEISENGITYNGTTYGVGDIIYIRNNEYSNYEYITIKGLGKGIAYVYYGIQDKIGTITNNFDVYNIRRLITTQLSLNPVDDIVEISTLAGLKTLLWSNDPVILNKNYKLMADITITNAYDYQSIGNTYYPFTGSFDGNGYTITNNVTTKHFALFNVVGGDRSSLLDTDNRKYIKNIKYIVNGCSYHNYIVENENIIFGTLINSCQAKSIIIENCNVYMKGYYTLRLDKINRCVVGMLIGYTNEAKVQNCNVFCERNELSFNKNKTPVYINVFGSLIGYSNASIIQNNNVVYRSITINPYYVLSYLTVTGGLIGYSRNDTIMNCLHYNTEYLIIQYVHTNGYYGGIIGYLEGTTISNCYYVGESRIYGFDSGKTNPNEIIGGVFGYINKNTVTNTNFNIQKCLAFYYKGVTDVRWCNTLSIVIGESPNISGSTIQDCYSIFRYPIETNTVPNIYSKTSSNNLTFNTRVSSNVITNNTATDNTVISTFLTNLQLESNITYAWLILYINQIFGVATTTDFTLQILNNINTQNSIVTKNIVFEQVKAKPNGIISTTYSNIKSSLLYKESSEDIDTTQVRLVTSDYTSFEPYRTYLILTKTDNNTITITINGNTTTITTNGNKIIKNGTEYNIGDIIPGPPTIKAKGIGSLYIYTAIPNTITTQVPVTNNNIIPADDGLQLWLDASDDTKIVTTANRTVGLESYPIVDAWLDKSGKNNHAVVAVDRSAPIYIDISQPKFENLSVDYVVNLSNFPVGLLDSKNAILVRGYETGTIDTLISQLSVSNNLGFFALVKKVGDGSIFGSPYNSNMQISSGLLYGSFTASDNSYINVTVADNNSTNIISTNNVDSATLLEHYTTTNNTFVTKINGTQVGTPATLYSNTINFINGLAFTGKYSNNATASSLIFEILIYNRILTPEEIQKIEGHILWKWGLESKLPSDHPYKSAAPTAPAPEEPDPTYNFGPLSQNGMALWLDSNDDQTLVFDTNKRQIGNAQYDVVIKWKDKSGNKKHAVPNSINSAPIYLPQVTYNFVTSADDTYMPGVGYYNSNNNLLSNRPTLAFRGREYGGAQIIPSKIDKLIAPIEVNNYMSFFAVVKKFSDGCIFGSGNLDGGSSYPNMVITYSYDYGSITDINGNALGSGIATSYQGVHFTNPTLIEHYNYTESVGSNGYFRTKVNASNTDIFNKTISSTTQFISNLQMVGRNNEIATSFIKEVIIYNRLLTQQEIQTIEGYLMWKWGINSLMPVTHPYYASPPTPTTYDFSSISIPTEPQAPSTTINYYTILNEGTLNGKMYFWLDADDATRMYTPYSRTIPGSSLSYQVITKLFDKSGKNHHASIHGTSTGPIYLSSIVQDFVNAATNIYIPGLNAFTIIKNKPALLFRHAAYNDFDSLIAKWQTERVFNEDLGEEQDAQRFFCAFIVFQKVDDGAPLFSLTDYNNNYSGYQISGGDMYGKIGEYGDDWTNGSVSINDDLYMSNPILLEYFISEDTDLSTETQKYYKYIRRLNGGAFESILPQGQFFDLFKNGIKINENDNVLMHEILIYNTPMTQVQVEKIEGYLAHKWNINSLLPSNHRYKAQSPLGGSGGSGGSGGGGGGPITETFDGTGTGVGPSLTIAIDNTATTIASFKVTADITSAGATAASKIKVYGFVWKAITDSTELKYNLLSNSRTLTQVAADITYNFAITPDFEKTVTGLEANTSYTVAAYAINSDNVITYTTPLIITTLGECPTAPIEPPPVNYDNLTIQGSQPVAITNDDKIVTLFKKFQGYPNTSKNIGLNAEYAANALPLTFPSQVATQVVPSLGIPSTNKIDNGEPDTLVFTSELFAGGGRHVWNANCHIAYYSKIVLTPTTQNPGQCFYIHSKQKNFLTNALLPTMSNDENKYNITVEKNIGTRQSPNWVILQPDYYVIDKDVGLLTIYEANSVINGTNPPRISFWRYEGLTLNTPGAILGGDIPSGALLFKDSTGKVSGTNSFQVVLDQLKTEFRIQGQMTVTGVVDPLGVTFDPTSKNPMDPTDPLYDTCLWYSRENSKFYFGDKILFMYDDIPENENYSGPTGPTGFTGIHGTQGAQGFTGSNGLQGVQGFTGPTGQRGIDGIAGSQGFTGTQGAQGFTGPMGPPGPAGSGGGGSLGDVAGTDIYLNIQASDGTFNSSNSITLFQSANEIIPAKGITYDQNGNITISETGTYEINIIIDVQLRQAAGTPVIDFDFYINNQFIKTYTKRVGYAISGVISSTLQIATILDIDQNDIIRIDTKLPNPTSTTFFTQNFYAPTLLIKRISKIQGPTGPAGSGGGGGTSLISSITIPTSSPQETITIPITGTIPTTYKYLELRWYNAYSSFNIAGNSTINMQLIPVAGTLTQNWANMVIQKPNTFNANVTPSSFANGQTSSVIYASASSLNTTAQCGGGTLKFYNYSNTNKLFISGTFTYNNSATNPLSVIHTTTALCTDVTDLSSIILKVDTGYSFSGTFELYGDNGGSGGGGNSGGGNGAQGAQGPTGPKGERGIDGIIGVDGAQGFTGATGAQGFQGPTGSTVGVNELYIQPAEPTNPTNTASSIQIIINWINPPQKQLSFLPIKVPFIKDIHITLEDASTPSNLITIYDSAIEDPYISTLVISNQTGASQKSGQTYTWYKNATNITGPFKVTIWYTNYSSDNPNKLIVENLAFATGGAPSVPITVTINTSDIQSNQALVTVTPGQYTDALLQNNLPTITSYNFIYKALSSSRRGGLAVVATDLTTTSATTTKTITSLYSGTTYEIAASATNSLGSTSEYFIPRAQFTTKLPELGDTIQTVNLSSYYSSVYSNAYNNGTQITNPIVFSGAQWPSSSLAINSIFITTGPDITGAKVAAVVNNGTSDSNNSEIVFTLLDGGINTVTNGADGKVIIAANSTVSDPYTAGDSGFYWQSDFKAQIGNQTAGLTVQTLKFTQSFTGSPTVNTRNIQFLVDNLPINTAPVITDYQITNNSEKESISGVLICPGNWSLEVSNVQTQNVVRYFHAQKLLTYSFANSNFQDLLTTFQGVGAETNTFLTSGLTITPGQADATYRYQPQITVVATNINKTNNTGQLSKTINIILDKPSKDLKNGFGANQNPNGSTAGERIKTSTTAYSEPQIQAGRTDFIAIYSQFRNTYDDTKAINTAIGTEGCNDLQLLGGRFITKSYTGIEGGYQNYGSGLDYSQIAGTGFRWVAFRWKLQSGEMSNLVFSIQGLIGNAIASLQQDSTSPKILLGSTKELKFYYRIENQADSGGTGNPSDVENTQNAGGGISTVWVDANSSNEQSNFGKYMGVRSYAGILGGVQTRNKITITGTTTKSIEYNVTTPTFQLGSSANVYIYAVVGLPMDVDIAFTGVRCTATFSS